VLAVGVWRGRADADCFAGPETQPLSGIKVAAETAPNRIASVPAPGCQPGRSTVTIAVVTEKRDQRGRASAAPRQGCGALLPSELPLIFSQPPKDWRELQTQATDILSAAGFDAVTDHKVSLARGHVKVDVWAVDTQALIPITYICECKLWKTSVPKEKVHAFRAVVGDAGAHVGFLIGKAGFQSGAREAADYSNVRLTTWDEFQRLLAPAWFRQRMAPRLVNSGDALHQYTEPINSWVARHVDRLSARKRARYDALKNLYSAPSFALLLRWFGPHGYPPPPSLPLRGQFGFEVEQRLPTEVLDAVTLTELLDAVEAFYRRATADFDELFGKRVPVTSEQ
jgi:restriction system protein